MNVNQLSSVRTPLSAAYDYCIMANAVHGEAHDRYIKAMLDRIRDAVENAGYDMVKRD